MAKAALIAALSTAALAVGALTLAAPAQADSGSLSATSAPHRSPGDQSQVTGIDFTVCNLRSFPAPVEDNDGTNDFGHVEASLTGGRSEDPLSFDIGAPRTGQNCITLLIRAEGYSRLDATITWPRRKGAGSASAFTVAYGLAIAPAQSESRTRKNRSASSEAAAPVLQRAPLRKSIFAAPATPYVERITSAPATTSAAPTPDPSNPARQRAYVDYLATHPAQDTPSPQRAAQPRAEAADATDVPGLLIGLTLAFAAAVALASGVLFIQGRR